MSENGVTSKTTQATQQVLIRVCISVTDATNLETTLARDSAGLEKLSIFPYGNFYPLLWHYLGYGIGDYLEHVVQMKGDIFIRLVRKNVFGFSTSFDLTLLSVSKVWTNKMKLSNRMSVLFSCNVMLTKFRIFN